MSIFHQFMSNVTVYTVHDGIPKLYCKTYLSPKCPILDLHRLLKPQQIRIVFDKKLIRKLFDRRIFVTGPQKNYMLTLGKGRSQELWLS